MADEVGPESAALGKCILLVSSMPATLMAEQNINRARALLDARKVVYEEVDGAEEANKEQRNALFAVSEKRGVYPQFFVEVAGNVSFVGDWEKLEGLNEIADLDEGTLENIKAADPDFQTLDEIFAVCEKVE